MTPLLWFLAGLAVGLCIACALPWLVDRLLVWCGLDDVPEQPRKHYGDRG